MDGMPEYRRNRVQGGAYFFTVVTYNRLPILTGRGPVFIAMSGWDGMSGPGQDEMWRVDGHRLVRQRRTLQLPVKIL